MESADGTDEAASVVLDIGGDVGALVVHTDASLRGVEIEISPNDGHGHDVFQAEHPHEHTHADGHTHTHAHTPGTTHVEVLGRRVGDEIRYAAIYPGLREGDYTLWNPDGTAAHTVRVVGGEVVELDWGAPGVD
ncbi:hypothetical protein [Jatrophihabitans endophyticus]|uniref:hypothetical protein n=1 Tax=Jatrophihabitans endophyticus TaxID=1206085 RepID=UPI001A01AA3A|nr:hypothetical protein [Jatrophihabitans endophyticus]MBE7189296.1 hypothetical protein [Jatrophihabitans endophyticus]